MVKTKIEDCDLHNDSYKVIKCSNCNKVLKIVDLEEIYQIYELKIKVKKLEDQVKELCRINGVIPL